MDISICICSYRRPMIADTIASVLAQHHIALTMEIIVAEDDPEQSIHPLIEQIAQAAPVPVRYTFSGKQNVAAARNLCLQTAQGTWIAFIDDDELAHPDWLSELLKAQQVFQADVVKGFVRAVYPPDTPQEIVDVDLFTRDYGPTGTALTEVATGNVLFRRSIAIENGISFEPDFGRSGGEDTDFFRRFSAHASKMISCQSAVVDEIVPPERVSFDYIRRRFQRLGQINGRQIRAHGTRKALIETIKAMIWALACLPYPLFRMFSGTAHFRGMTKHWYGRGFLQGLLGIASEEMI